MKFNISAALFYFSTLILFGFHSALFAQDVVQMNNENKSLSYEQAIEIYKNFDKQSDKCKLITEGQTDIGLPLHLLVLSSDKTFNPIDAKKKGKSILLINNGIHPGEPDGIDASVRLVQNIISGKTKLPSNIVVCIVPIFNIGGSLNNRCCTRANQNGPEVQGFRGNAKNLDLNRDFIKCDSENSRSLISIMRTWDPDVFVDTHVSNGADYQYTMTLISTQHNKMGGEAGRYLKQVMTPGIFNLMNEKGVVMSPYVHTSQYDDTPESGIYGYLETPRYASGYASLFNCFAFVSETHMLKPFAKRVDATQKLLEVFIEFTSSHSGEIIAARKKASDEIKNKYEIPISFELDSTKFEEINFNGFEAVYRISNVTGLKQLYYDTLQPYTRKIKLYDYYNEKLKVKRPQFYIIPQAWKDVIEILKLNNIAMNILSNDTVIEVESYVIEDFKTSTNPYEGHYLHNSVKLKTQTIKLKYRKGDFIIPVNQASNKYIIESLEPNAPDSFFAWGFFDSVLQQKEWFSDYVFDEVAEKMLNENQELKREFEEKKKSDPEFAGSAFDQLYFIYKQSPWFEDLRRYPVARIY